MSAATLDSALADKMQSKESRSETMIGVEGSIEEEAATSSASSLGPGHTVQDEKDMRRMGKKQEFLRSFRLVSAIGFTSCVMGTWELLYTQNLQALVDGGRAGMFWSYCWVYFGQTFIVLSLAEMCSMAPTAGGQYHWVSEFAPPSCQKILSYTSGWLSTLCWACFTAIDASLVANLILALIVINDQTFTPEPWMTTVLVIATILVISGINIFGGRKLALLQNFFVSLHFLLFVPVIVILLVKLPKLSASEVFLDFGNRNAGWSSLGLTLMVGQVSAMFTVQASDSVAHMSEEIQGASWVAPVSMVSAYLLNMPFAFGILLVFLFTIGSDLTPILALETNPTGLPFIYPLLHSAGPGTATAVTVLMLILILMIATSTTASTSRQIFAFARDRGFPFGKQISLVSRRWRVPIYSIGVATAWTIILSLVYLGSTVAFSAFVAVSIVAIMATYTISIGCVLYRRVMASRGRAPPLPASRYSLRYFGIPVNTVALLFCIYSFFWCFWPVYNSVDPVSFNWAIVIFGGVMTLAAVAYVLNARKKYTGPVAQTEGFEASF